MSAQIIECITGKDYIKSAEEQAAGIKKEAQIETAIAFAGMAARYLLFSRITGLKEELADRRQAMAEETLRHAQGHPTTGPWAQETKLVQDTMAEPKYVANYGVAGIATNRMRSAATQARESIDREADRLGIAASACTDARTERGMAIARTDLVAYAMRTEEARAIKLNDRRVSRQLSVIGMSKGVMATALSMGELGGVSNAIVADGIIGALNAGYGLWRFNNDRWGASGQHAATAYQTPRVVGEGQRMVRFDNVNGTTDINLVLPEGNARAAVAAENAASQRTPAFNPATR